MYKFDNIEKKKLCFLDTGESVIKIKGRMSH